MHARFLISSEYRGGVHDGSIHTYKLCVNGKEADLSLKRTFVEAGVDSMGRKTAGWMFRPFYYLTIEKRLKKGEVLKSCLKIQQAD